MSPEQYRCVAIDRRSDIFSAGVVLSELSTARRLREGEDEYEIMKRTAEGPLPRPPEIVKGYPKQLESIVRMALEKKPANRFQTALEMQQALENFASVVSGETAKVICKRNDAEEYQCRTR